jgi:formiminotetrahydrofolate cyclodeaminase
MLFAIKGHLDGRQLQQFKKQTMKIIKINHTLNLKSGIEIPTGAVVLLNEVYIKSAQRTVDANKNVVIEAECATIVYASQEALTNGKTNLEGIEDFEPVFNKLFLLASDYAILDCEDLMIQAVKAKLAETFSVQDLEIVEI